MYLITAFIFSILLIICIITDIKTRKINLILCLFFLLTGISIYLFVIQSSFYILCCNLMTGIFLLIIAKLTHGAIGYGDGIIFLIMSFYLPDACSLAILFLSLASASLFSIILLLKKFSRKYAIPFVPFILCGYSIYTAIQFFTGGFQL